MVESTTNSDTTNATNAPATDAAQNDEENKNEEQSPFMEETFEDPLIAETKFKSDWTLWEHYEDPRGEKIDYTQSMCKACWFNDMISFATAWNTIPHSDLTNIFYNDESKTVKM